jgi:hypothetical protein
MEHIKKILVDICKADLSRWGNERYLHHYFSQQVQRFYPVDFANPKLHPEWTTRGSYNDKENNTGNFDFAVEYGNCDDKANLIAVEFKLFEGWNGDGVVWDYVKLLDKRNADIKCAISLCIINRPDGLAQGGRLERLIRRINDTIADVKDLLGDKLATDRPFLFVVAEKYKAEVRLWYLNNLKSAEFKRTDNVNDLLTLI